MSKSLCVRNWGLGKGGQRCLVFAKTSCAHCGTFIPTYSNAPEWQRLEEEVLSKDSGEEEEIFSRLLRVLLLAWWCQCMMMISFYHACQTIIIIIIIMSGCHHWGCHHKIFRTASSYQCVVMAHYPHIRLHIYMWDCVIISMCHTARLIISIIIIIISYH